MIKHIALSAAFFTVAGCASILIPPETLQSSESAIRGAEEIGAENVPDAKLHLQLARDQTAAAKQLSLNGDERAIVMLARAQSDADLANGLAREAAAHAEAVKAAEDLKAVRARGTP
jgi:hypothetical protein